MINFELVNALLFVSLVTLTLAQAEEINSFKKDGETHHPHYKRLALFAPLATLAEFVYTIIYGWYTVWWAGVVLLFTSWIIAFVILKFLSKVKIARIPLNNLLSVIGLVAIPILLVVCFLTMPS